MPNWEGSATADLIASRHFALMEAFSSLGHDSWHEKSNFEKWKHTKKWKCILKWRCFLGGHRYWLFEIMPFRDRVKRRLRHILPAGEKTWDNIHNEDIFLMAN